MLLQFLLGAICWQADATDLYGSGIKISSYATELGYRNANPSGLTGTKLDMNNPWYMTKADNPQFGYDVTLIRFVDQNGEITTGSVVSGAPGNPRLEFTDPGYAEIQNLDNLPQSASATVKNVIILMPAPLKKYTAHTMYGTSLVVATSVMKEATLKIPKNYLYIGAPEGASCDDREPVGSDSLSMDSYGKLYSVGLGYDSSSGEFSDDSIATYKIPQSACFSGQSFNDIGDGAQQGFNQANRNMYGFSSHISKNGKLLLLGAPMFRQQAGYVNIKYREDLVSKTFKEYQEAFDIKYCFLCDPDKLEVFQSYNSEEGEKVEFSSIICDVDLTFGYSLTSLKIGTDQYLATGGPRAQGILGEIKIFKFSPSESFIVDSFSFLNPLVGRDINTGFGTTILGADLDGDGIDELIVGEPYKTDDTTSTFNSGVVSIYQYDNGNYNFVYELKSPYPSETNLFGFKVACIGDADADGGEDILVTALNETRSGGGSGTVYLFSGRSLSSVYSVTLRRKDYPDILHTFTEDDSELFGFSIGDEKTDLDGNGFFDLVVGDPGKKAQNAHVYYANTIIRVLFSDKIPKRLLYTNPQIHADCPVPNLSGINFCQPITITLENRGFLEANPLEPDDPPTVSKWAFRNNFRVVVNFGKQPDQSLIQVYNQNVTATFGPSIETAEVTFFIYAVSVPEVYGTGMRLIADTNLERLSSLDLINSYKFKGATVLASNTFKDIDVAISPAADVTMTVDPQTSYLFLGTTKKSLEIDVMLQTKSGQLEKFVSAELRILLGTGIIKFSTALSSPIGLATCQRDGVFVSCRFTDGKKFKNANLRLTFLTGSITSGSFGETDFPMTYKLTWANRELDERKEIVSGIIKVQYNAKLNVNAIDASVASNTRFNQGRGNTLDYSISVENQGLSDIGKTSISVYVPYDPRLFSVFMSDCQKTSTIENNGKCSHSQCERFYCTMELKGLEKRIISVSANFKDADFWTELVTGKKEFSLTAVWSVLEGASYNSNLQDMFPKNREGSVTAKTVITYESTPFPWWIVVVTLLVSIVVVGIVMFILYRKGFFTKKNHNQIREDEIGNEEYNEEDQEMSLRKFEPYDC